MELLLKIFGIHVSEAGIITAKTRFARLVCELEVQSHTLKKLEDGSYKLATPKCKSLPTDPIELSEYLHDNYEEISKSTNWDTQKNCKVPFKDLPNENKTTMILLASKLITDFGNNKNK